jgi:hypothetical protein
MFIKMKFIVPSSIQFIRQGILFTDKSLSYVDVAGYVGLHITEKSSKKTA